MGYKNGMESNVRFCFRIDRHELKWCRMERESMERNVVIELDWNEFRWCVSVMERKDEMENSRMGKE